MLKKLSWVTALAVAACSGKAVIDGSANGAGGAGGAGSTTTTVANGPVTTGTVSCQSHDDCPSGNVCIFGKGVCAPACQAQACESCGTGSICDDCATSSCPGCDDCRAACVPLSDGACDDDDPCKEGAVCMFFQHQCVPGCTADGGCVDPGLSCAGCASTSCCGCKDCVSACLPIN